MSLIKAIMSERFFMDFSDTLIPLADLVVMANTLSATMEWP